MSQITENGSALHANDLFEGLCQLKRFNARRKFRSVVALLVAKAKLERLVADAKLARLSVQPMSPAALATLESS